MLTLNALGLLLIGAAIGVVLAWAILLLIAVIWAEWQEWRRRR